MEKFELRIIYIRGVEQVKVSIANHDYTIQWDGIYYFALSGYPNISSWELKKLIYLDEYEKSYGREMQIDCEDKYILDIVNQALLRPEDYRNVQPPYKITECTACKFKCCLTDYVCHTASIENAKSIISSGKLLSATRAFSKTVNELVHDQRNAAGDTPDYFEYIMFAWGNCQAGDNLVMERMLNKSPSEQDLSLNFKPGIRFYFRYDDLVNHPSFVFDGYHVVKIKDELLVADYLFVCIIPEDYKSEFENIIPDIIKERVIYVNNDCKDIWDWSEKVYNFVINLSRAV